MGRGTRKRGIIHGGVFFGVACAALLVGHLLDGPAYRSMHHPELADGEDWARALRVMGYLPLWLVVGVALVLNDWAAKFSPPIRDRWSRGLLVFLGAALSGLAAEGGKLLVRRLRPEAAGGGYEFRPYAEDLLSASNLGFPSSHTAVAFGAAWVLCRLKPRLAPIWIALAIGCGVQRVLERAHFVSDTVGAALVAYAVVAVLWSLHERKLAKGGAESGGAGL